MFGKTKGQFIFNLILWPLTCAGVNSRKAIHPEVETGMNAAKELQFAGPLPECWSQRIDITDATIRSSSRELAYKAA